jgi:hypothetical protein
MVLRREYSRRVWLLVALVVGALLASSLAFSVLALIREAQGVNEFHRSVQLYVYRSCSAGNELRGVLRAQLLRLAPPGPARDVAVRAFADRPCGPVASEIHKP